MLTNHITLKASLILKSQLAFSEMVTLINDKFNWNLEFDDSGYTEECPSYSFRTMNHNIRIVGSSNQLVDIYTPDQSIYSLTIDEHPKAINSLNINFGQNIKNYLSEENFIKIVKDNYDTIVSINEWCFENIIGK